MNTEQERRDFENHFRRKGFTLKREPGGDYRSGYGAEVWAGWQARAALQSHSMDAVQKAIDKLDAMTPRPPTAITYDQGWAIIDVVQRHLCTAIDHARRVEGDGE